MKEASWARDSAEARHSQGTTLTQQEDKDQPELKEMCPFTQPSPVLNLYTCERITVCSCVRVLMSIMGEPGGEGCCMDRNREEKTDGTGKDVCLAGEVNKIEAVL